MSAAPSEILETWIHRIPRGPALDLGAGEGAAALWLAERGFAVDAVERDPDRSRRLEQAADSLPVRVHQADLLRFPLPSEHYVLIVAHAVLHFLRPSELWPLADRLVEALSPGGYLAAEVFTTDDPGYNDVRALGGAEIEPNTYPAPEPTGLIHYFAPGELRRVFSQLEVLFYEESRRVDPGAAEEFRAGASLLARKPYEE